ncbi:MAG: glutamate racemase [Deltaproteobacteria bacterium]|nr:glutamate racemase [Deltaproteobacteria bacterium]
MTTQPIGVFDSGLGGLTVVRALQRRLPHEQLVYLGDTARVPYGTKSATTVIRYASQIAQFLLALDVKYLVVACNTASAHALTYLEQTLPIPVLGVVEPGAHAAAGVCGSGQVGVIGTLGTVDSGAYQRAIQLMRPDLTIFSQPCPLLVPLAEEGWLEHPVTSEVVRHYLQELQAHAGNLDTLVLGCTHYPLLRQVIASEAERVFGHPVKLVDSAEATAEAAEGDLRERNLLSKARLEADRFFFTDVNRFAEVAGRFLGRPVTGAELADLSI